jgi:Na+/H+-dicarboxylate symporter
MYVLALSLIFYVHPWRRHHRSIDRASFDATNELESLLRVLVELGMPSPFAIFGHGNLLQIFFRSHPLSTKFMYPKQIQINLKPR